MKPIVCTACDLAFSETKLQHETVPTTGGGEVELTCLECEALLTIQFFCQHCETWFRGKDRLHKYDTGTVTEHVCPHCDGILSKGQILTVTKDNVKT